MNKPIIRTPATFLLLSLTFVLASPARSQELIRLELPLTLNEQESGFANFTIHFDEKISDSTRVGKAPGGVLISLEKLNDPPNAYRIRVDADGDGNLSNESPRLLSPNSSINVRVTRPGTKRSLLYTIEYSRELDKSNTVQERVSWSPHYRAEGKIKINNCEALLVALDLNGDGRFDGQDFAQGTSIGLDRNADGRIWGREEWLSGNQIIEYCGRAFLVNGIDVNGSHISLIETSLRVPKIGERLPEFSLMTVEAKTIELHDLKGKIHLLDFWASWCKPCVEKFILVKQLDARYGDELAIIGINVDENARLAMAHHIVKDYDLEWPQVMKGQGEADPLWKVFGSMENNRLAIPLYVLIDPRGILRYTGNGGEDLSEIRKVIEELQKSK